MLQLWAFDLEAKGAKEESLDRTSLKTLLVVEKQSLQKRLKQYTLRGE